MAIQAIDTILFASSHPDTAKRTSISGLIIFMGMMLVGIPVFTPIFEMSNKSSTSSMGLMVLDTALILLGVFRLFWKSKEIVYPPAGSVAKERSLLFNLRHIGKLIEMLESGKLGGEAGVKNESSGSVRLGAMISQDNKLAALQLFQFVSYTYTPVTSVYYFTGNEATAISAFLSRCKAM